MSTEVKKGLTLTDLEIHKIGLLDRIKRIEADLRSPLDLDSYEQSGQVSNQIILKRLLEIERSNLIKVNYELEKKALEAQDVSG